jgi:hypothetical protein
MVSPPRYGASFSTSNSERAGTLAVTISECTPRTTLSKGENDPHGAPRRRRDQGGSFRACNVLNGVRRVCEISDSHAQW